ncbi:MAG: hypothetical protein H6R16_236, partial [Proteobacteria bacterium]|nr:hypothetical protein [Pseudomonadota bacterium]
MNLLRRLLMIFVPLAMLLLGAWGEAIGQAESGGAVPSLVFEHAKTGFILDNAHKMVPCESCHTAGTFRGTPKVCSTCHAGAGTRAPGKSLKHIPTAAATCDSCHGTIAWQPARMDHNVVSTIACSSCHNGIFTEANSLAKPVTHLPTNAACNSCHTSVTAFSPAAMNHAGTAGQCNSCHNGAFVSANAQTKGPNHVATTAQCDQCHPSTSTWFASVFDHVASPPVTGRCSDCHNGSRAVGKSRSHVPTTAQCDTCHTSTMSFAGARMDHSGTSGACSSCHSGGYTAVNALAKPATHVSTSAQCDGCHQSTVTWLGAKFDHTTVSPAAAGRCATCHNGTTAVGKQAFAAHIPTTASCDVCHTSFSAFAPARMNHAGATGPAASGNCATCHSGTYISSNAQTKSATHSSTVAQCDTCHGSTSTWATATWNHAVTDTNCSSCHNNNPAVGMPTTHIPTTAQCSSCHKNTTSFRPAAMDHTGLTDCRSCHGGAYVYANALTKPTTHIPTTAQCSTCHTGFSVFAPASMSHAGTSGPVAAGNCATCHGGAYLAVNAQARPISHIPTGTQACDACHGTTAWKPTTFSHTGVVVGSGTCATSCHDGTHALGKPATHLPTTAACDVCHTNFTAFAPTRMNHTGTTGPAATVNSGTCSTCHGGAYVAINAQIKPASHVSTTAQCDSCHTSTASWATKVFNHASASPAAAGNCSTCHNGTTALGKPTTHIPTTAQCDTCHGNFNAFRPATMSHTGTTGPIAPGNCSLCHGGGYLFANALAKPTTHVLTNMQCDTCHTGGYTSWTGAKFIHSATATGSCSTCHNGSTALGKPTSHIPTTAQCDSCHGNYVAFKPAAMNHSGTAAQCSTCHSGTYTAVN